jgi:diadenosine tetraphosphate (Ap4A) HIT family hydrolase
MSSCLFCNINESIFDDSHFWIIKDNYPVSNGHTLIIPKRHILSLFDLDQEDFVYLHKVINKLKIFLDQQYNPDGFNIGINDGKASGRTIEHLHIHVIPRYINDQKDPRGGIRLIFPEKANYWDD